MKHSSEPTFKWDAWGHNSAKIPEKENLVSGRWHRLPSCNPCRGSHSVRSFRVIYFSLCSYPRKGDIWFTIRDPKLEKFNSFSGRISLKFVSTRRTAVVRNVIELHIPSGVGRCASCWSTPPSPGPPLSPAASIRSFPKTFTSSFPVQNPKIIVSGYLKPVTDWRTTGTNKTLLGQPSLAVYKQDTHTKKGQSHCPDKHKESCLSRTSLEVCTAKPMAHANALY